MTPVEIEAKIIAAMRTASIGGVRIEPHAFWSGDRACCPLGAVALDTMSTGDVAYRLALGDDELRAFVSGFDGSSIGSV